LYPETANSLFVQLVDQTVTKSTNPVF